MNMKGVETWFRGNSVNLNISHFVFMESILVYLVIGFPSWEQPNWTLTISFPDHLCKMYIIFKSHWVILGIIIVLCFRYNMCPKNFMCSEMGLLEAYWIMSCYSYITVRLTWSEKTISWEPVPGSVYLPIHLPVSLCFMVAMTWVAFFC